MPRGAHSILGAWQHALASGCLPGPIDNTLRIWRTINATATNALVHLLWQQWGVMGAPARSAQKEPYRNVIDVEVLISASTELVGSEPRLNEMTAWWAASGAQWTSLHRLRHVARNMTGTDRHVVHQFAQDAAHFGHTNWKKVRGAMGEPSRGAKNIKSQPQVNMENPALLQVRMRAMFGLGVKSDILTILIGLGGASRSTAELAALVGCTATAARAALRDMTRARLVDEEDGGVSRFKVDATQWWDFLAAQKHRTRYVDFLSPCSFMLDAARLSESALNGGENDYLLASRARDLLDKHAPALRKLPVPLPPTDTYTGLEQVKGLHQMVDALAKSPVFSGHAS